MTFAQSPVPLLFESNWELGPTGSSNTSLRDGTRWTDYNPSAPQFVSVVTSEKHDGAQSLQMAFPPSSLQNGPAPRLTFEAGGTPRQELWFRFWMKNSSNWVWGNNQHKLLFIQNSNGQNVVVLDVYADGQRGGQGRLNVYNQKADQNFYGSDSDPKITPGMWHLIELHIKAGPNGMQEARIDGVPLTLRSSPGNVNPKNFDVGSDLTYWKLDGTYNDYAYPSSLGLTMYRWYDSFAVSSQGWINSGPAPPTNVRIVG